ncbi:heptosyltransferase-1 [Formivibrio citricus]|uniref:Lipopolysaccharide heptosyltransferase 1 n=1 Tax=Formivibrio citricus TaxID=83765 RepID=A0A1I4YNP5_9NEIS|nr:lipopolysaccharide heptosyltransferase I [Formivibrio citricus]SFN39646.1 heptosyltransferase-1 [Formivibrio citricus]
MQKILLVRLSSMGDVIHNLPAVTDLARACPQTRIDWVVEEGFQEIPRLHPAISRVIPVGMRRWRKTPVATLCGDDLGRFAAELRCERYDLVLDSQGLVKSALVAKLAKGPVAGYDSKSIREPAASLFYDRRYAVSRELHAIDRNRLLSAAALGYEVTGPIDYGLLPPQLSLSWLSQSACVTLLTATSRADKEWPEERWQALGKRFVELGLTPVLPWGNETERARSERLAAGIPGAICPPRLSLTEAAALLAGSRIVVGVDTGLAHLAAALATPVVAIFCASDPFKTGVRAAYGAVNLGANGAPPDIDTVWQAVLAGIRQ